jgi:hypothetical protein
MKLGDTEAKVRRSAEQRQEEVNSKKNNGKIPRPMNSFMLYRSAYAERVKEYCKEGNHQIISQVTGASWALEPQSVKAVYEKFAEIDRQNHQNAHPGYKFAPNKNNAARKKRKGHDQDDEHTDWDEQEYDGGSSYSKRSRYNQSIDSRSRSRSSTPFDNTRQPNYGRMAMGLPVHPSSYQATNPRSVPPAYPIINDPEHYYQQWATPYAHNIEDVHVRSVPRPGASSYPQLDDQSLVGLPLESDPGAPLQTYPEFETAPYRMQPNALDPRLTDPQYSVRVDNGTAHAPYGRYDPLAHPPPSMQEYDYAQAGFDQGEYIYPNFFADDHPTATTTTSAPPDHEYAYHPDDEDAGTAGTTGLQHPGMATLTSPRAVWDPSMAGSDFDDALSEM